MHSSSWRGSDSGDYCQDLLVSEGLLWADEAAEMGTRKQPGLAKMEGLCPEVWSRTLVLTWWRCGKDSGLIQT